MANGARNGVIWDQVLFEAGISLFYLVPWETVVLKTGVLCRYR